MLINDLGWRGEAALQCGFVDTNLGRAGVKHHIQIGEAELHLFLWFQEKQTKSMSVILFLPLQSRPCVTLSSATSLISWQSRRLYLGSVSGMLPCFSICVSFRFVAFSLQLVVDILGQIHQFCHSKNNIQFKASCLPCYHPTDFLCQYTQDTFPKHQLLCIYLTGGVLRE